jgi:hypothetical protein
LAAPDDRRRKAMFEVNGPTFLRLEPPLSDICSYISFLAQDGALEKHVSVRQYMKPDFLYNISDHCVIED